MNEGSVETYKSIIQQRYSNGAVHYYGLNEDDKKVHISRDAVVQDYGYNDEYLTTSSEFINEGNSYKLPLLGSRALKGLVEVEPVNYEDMISDGSTSDPVSPIDIVPQYILNRSAAARERWNAAAVSTDDDTPPAPEANNDDVVAPLDISDFRTPLGEWLQSVAGRRNADDEEVEPTAEPENPADDSDDEDSSSAAQPAAATDSSLPDNNDAESITITVSGEVFTISRRVFDVPAGIPSQTSEEPLAGSSDRAAVPTTAEKADLHDSRPDIPKKSRRRRLIKALAGIALTVGTFAALIDREPPQDVVENNTEQASDPENVDEAEDIKNDALDGKSEQQSEEISESTVPEINDQVDESTTTSSLPIVSQTEGTEENINIATITQEEDGVILVEINEDADVDTAEEENE